MKIEHSRLLPWFAQQHKTSSVLEILNLLMEKKHFLISAFQETCSALIDSYYSIRLMPAPGLHDF